MSNELLDDQDSRVVELTDAEATPASWSSAPRASLAAGLASAGPADGTGGSGWGRLVAIAAAVTLVIAVVLLLGFKADSRLTFEVSGAAAQGGLIEATRGEATVALSDGSSILAENGSKFSVDVLGRNAARTRLIEGRLHVRVVHNDDTSYRFVAGPYEIQVVGTEFDLAWGPAGAGLTLSMARGEVRLILPGGSTQRLHSGQSLRLPIATAD
jgi:ferric-dicitrate binding protein FerR (iron transport regulator)